MLLIFNILFVTIRSSLNTEFYSFTSQNCTGLSAGILQNIEINIFLFWRLWIKNFFGKDFKYKLTVMVVLYQVISDLSIYTNFNALYGNLVIKSIQNISHLCMCIETKKYILYWYVIWIVGSICILKTSFLYIQNMLNVWLNYISTIWAIQHYVITLKTEQTSHFFIFKLI